MVWADDLVSYAASQLDDRVQEALWSRGVSDAQIQAYHIGYLDRKLPPLEGAETFLKWAKDGARLEDVFVFPLTNYVGGVRGFQFRPVKRENHEFSDFFVDPAGPDLFGVAQAGPAIWETETVCLVEGPFDLFPAQRHFPYILSTLTARVTDATVRFLRRVVKRVILFYDNDATGRSGVAKFQKWHSREFEVVDLCPPKVHMVDGKLAKDPGDLWEVWGDVQLGKYLRCMTEVQPQP